MTARGPCGILYAMAMLLTLLLLLVAGCGDSDSTTDPLPLARAACTASADGTASACLRQCPRFAEAARRDQCESDCNQRQAEASGLCEARTRTGSDTQQKGNR